ncbi:hypothetical protein FS837_011151 [Tulasnella sp. UAMH 9824]|nr:hypothetical protein FS837_011151 [Tulasnella sp. UAMH 9824]
MNNIQTVTVDEFTYTRESDLASSALVCKLWNEVATECLWRELPSALCLLCLLGEMMYEEPDGWWKTEYSSRINIDAIQAAFSWYNLDTHFDTFLPRVKAISWAADDSYPSSQLPYFISSCLQRLTFTRISNLFSEDPRGELEHVIDIFEPLIRKQCQLSHLIFCIPWSLLESAELRAALSGFVSNQTLLREMEIRDWMDESLLASMTAAGETLVSLSCWINAGEGGELGRIMDALSTGFGVLRDLNVNVTGDMTNEDFKRFLQLRSLRRVTFEVVRFPILEEVDIEAMSRAWPDIEQFMVKQVFGTRQPLSILSTFAKWMGSTVQVLELGLDATGELPLVAADSFNFVKLRELRIGAYSPAPHDPKAVAEYLRSLSLGSQSTFKLVICGGAFHGVGGWRKVVSSFGGVNIAAEEAR